MLDALRAADVDDAVGAIVLTGAGQGFCAGADLSEFKDLQAGVAAENRAELTMQLHLAFSKHLEAGRARSTAMPWAAARGSLAADIAVMADSARLGYPEPSTASSPRS